MSHVFQQDPYKASAGSLPVFQSEDSLLSPCLLLMLWSIRKVRVYPVLFWAVWELLREWNNYPISVIFLLFRKAKVSCMFMTWI